MPNGSWIELSIWQRLIFRGTKRSAYGLWATVDFFMANSALRCQSLHLQSKDNALSSGRRWKGNQPLVYQASPTCVTTHSWGPDLGESLCKVADMRASLLTGSHSNPVTTLYSLLVFPVSPFMPSLKGPGICGSISSELAFLWSRPMVQGYTVVIY